ncbi:MAG: SGNH/GDSL hydrolase family protein [Acidobacteriota bacterium]|nr:SGNH/GDSL hydrolase family protein [Acidobacteriota bacterium]
MPPKPLKKTVRVVIGLSILFFLTAGSALAECPGEVKPSAEDPMQMLVLGDSIMWGLGLQPEQKFSWRVKCWLQEKTGREVQTRIEAHSGALLAGASTTPPRFKSNDGEVNLPFPTINEQLDNAVRFYGHARSSVDLILVDGCINDVDVSNLLNAGTTTDWLRQRITTTCGAGMHNLLRRITESFPNAHVVVTGYYRMISTNTDDNAFIRLIVKKLNSGSREAQRMTYKEMRERLITLSELWYKVSTASLNEAVSKVNEDLGEKSLPPRAMFVEIEFWPEHSFSASNTLLWNFMFGSTNLSGFRKIIVALSLGTAAYKPNDDARESRIKSCNETYKAPKAQDGKGRKETEEEKRDRKNRLLICRYASLGHPNPMGGLIYAEAIKGKLQWLIDKAGWKRSIAAH